MVKFNQHSVPDTLFMYACCLSPMIHLISKYHSAVFKRIYRNYILINKLIKYLSSILLKDMPGYERIQFGQQPQEQQNNNNNNNANVIFEGSIIIL